MEIRMTSEVLKGEKCFDPYLRCALHGAALTLLRVENCGVLGREDVKRGGECVQQ
jgi:hypothetical protein